MLIDSLRAVLGLRRRSLLALLTIPAPRTKPLRARGALLAFMPLISGQNLPEPEFGEFAVACIADLRTENKLQPLDKEPSFVVSDCRF